MAAADGFSRRRSFSAAAGAWPHGVRRPRSVASLSAPASSRSCAQLRLLPRAAQCSGVKPPSFSASAWAVRLYMDEETSCICKASLVHADNLAGRHCMRGI